MNDLYFERAGNGKSGLRIGVIGGSGYYTPEFVEALVRKQSELPVAEVVLNGRSPEKLEQVGRVCQKIADAAGSPLKVRTTTERRVAIEGMDFVLCQVRVGGMAARAMDERFPLEFGIIGEETTGPGGFANAMRTVPVVLEIAREIERYSPATVLVMLTNPAGITVEAVKRYTKVKVFGACDLPVALLDKMARVAGVSGREELDYKYYALNHLGWFGSVNAGGRDLMPLLMERAADLGPGIDGGVVRRLGLIPLPYLKYYYHAERLARAAAGKPTRAEYLLEVEERLSEAYTDPAGGKPALVEERHAIWYGEVIVPLLRSLVNNGPPARHIMITANNGICPELPDDAVIEVPTLVGGGMINPVAQGPIPAQILELLRRVKAYEQLAVRAAAEKSGDLAVEALAAHPLVRDRQQARSLWNRVEEINAADH
ncbi:MAG: 6-phospho-beta-glucosidase [Firmicutes bacterium]|nr:6-phospho-beta-glucosidase [Bacillota bacterium]